MLGVKIRTVKSHFNHMYNRFGIEGGVKRVKLAVLLYRMWNVMETKEKI